MLFPYLISQILSREIMAELNCTVASAEASTDTGMSLVCYRIPISSLLLSGSPLLHYHCRNLRLSVLDNPFIASPPDRALSLNLISLWWPLTPIKESCRRSSYSTNSANQKPKSFENSSSPHLSTSHNRNRNTMCWPRQWSHITSS